MNTRREASEMLGVDTDASETEIKRRWRELARTHHPDNGGDPKTFSTLRAAYDTLTSREPDRTPRAPQEHATSWNLDDLTRFTRRARTQRLEIDTLQAHEGCRREVHTRHGTLHVELPPGLEEGTTLALGDERWQIHITPHPLYQLKDDTIEAEVPISVQEALLGGTITVPTPEGPKTIRLPEANLERRLRIPYTRRDGTTTTMHIQPRIERTPLPQAVREALEQHPNREAEKKRTEIVASSRQKGRTNT